MHHQLDFNTLTRKSQPLLYPIYLTYLELFDILLQRESGMFGSDIGQVFFHSSHAPPSFFILLDVCGQGFIDQSGNRRFWPLLSAHLKQFILGNRF